MKHAVAPAPFLIPRRWAFTYDGEWEDLRRHFAGDFPLPEATTRTFEETAAQYFGMPDAACVNSGRQGMALIFERIGLSVGDEVIAPAYTLLDLIPLIERFGAKVIPADIDPATMNVTAASVAARISPRTRAVLVLHAFGVPAPVKEICALADEHDFQVVEDCAHAMGATIDGAPVGTFGYAGFFSFEPTKPINTYGGGMVISRDTALLDHIREVNNKNPLNLDTLQTKVNTVHREQQLLRSGLGLPILYGFSHPVSKRVLARIYRSRQSVPSNKVRYAPVQAHVGLRKLETLGVNLAERAALAERYDATLPSNIIPQARPADSRCTYYFYTVRLPEPAARLRTQLLRRGVDAAVEEEIADNIATPLGYTDCPNADALCPRAMALPLYEGMTESQVDRVVETLARAVNG